MWERYTRRVAGRMLCRVGNQYSSHCATVQVWAVVPSEDCAKTASRARRAAAFDECPPRRAR